MKVIHEIVETIRIAHYRSPVGEMLLGSYGDRLCLCDWVNGKRRISNDRRLRRHFVAGYENGLSDVILRTITELEEYFGGKRRDFTIPIIFAGSEFQCHVWKELMLIPYGATISYSTIAQSIGNPGAVRAVASAVAANSMSVIVPCHRVIGRDRRLTGYAGGVDVKQALLDLESSELTSQCPLIPTDA